MRDGLDVHVFSRFLFLSKCCSFLFCLPTFQ